MGSTVSVTVTNNTSKSFKADWAERKCDSETLALPVSGWSKTILYPQQSCTVDLVMSYNTRCYSLKLLFEDHSKLKIAADNEKTFIYGGNNDLYRIEAKRHEYDLSIVIHDTESSKKLQAEKQQKIDSDIEQAVRQAVEDAQTSFLQEAEKKSKLDARKRLREKIEREIEYEADKEETVRRAVEVALKSFKEEAENKSKMDQERIQEITEYRAKLEADKEEAVKNAVEEAKRNFEQEVESQRKSMEKQYAAMEEFTGLFNQVVALASVNRKELALNKLDACLEKLNAVNSATLGSTSLLYTAYMKVVTAYFSFQAYNEAREIVAHMKLSFPEKREVFDNILDVIKSKDISTDTLHALMSQNMN